MLGNEPAWQRRESGWVLNETMMRRHRRMDHDLSSFRYDRSSMGSNSIRASNSASSTLVVKTDAGFTPRNRRGSMMQGRLGQRHCPQPHSDNWAPRQSNARTSGELIG
jgi:hypothetical protein